ncbi:MAG: hypothetical protein AAFY20_14760 [Cyanobacteria bacterium J06639_14]
MALAIDCDTRALGIGLNKPSKKSEQSPVSTYPANRYRVGMRVSLVEEETWIVTALDFVFRKAFCGLNLGGGVIDDEGEKREVALSKLPAE